MFTKLLLILTLLSSTTSAQNRNVEYIIFVLNNTLYAHATHRADLRTIGTGYPDGTLPGTSFDIYDAENSPILPDKNYGFHHGIWSPDRQKFVSLQIQFPHYQLKLFSEGSSHLLLEDNISDQRGYLVPLGWKTDGNILLMERYMLYNLKNTVRIWQLDPASGTLIPYANTSIGHLHGQNMVMLEGHSAFIGFDGEHGYFFDFESGQFSTIEAKFPLKQSSVFEIHPIQVLGVISSSQLVEFINQLSPAASAPYPDPFLYWPLPATERRITCYPDSPHTTATYEVNCPALGHMYPGHQGTDIGGLPDGLPIGTEVYAAAPGIVIDTYTECDDSNPSCGDAYGNYITLEHTLTVNGNTQTWFTGYGHLQSVDVTPFTVLTDITVPIGTSGSTGQGGPHLHFEVRSLYQWVDPWADPVLWIGGPTNPVASMPE